jgi:hypothetical protein
VFSTSLRGALVDYFQEQGGVRPRDIRRHFAQKEGYGSQVDHTKAVEPRDGGAYMDAFVFEFRRLAEAAASRGTLNSRCRTKSSGSRRHTRSVASCSTATKASMT